MKQLTDYLKESGVDVDRIRTNWSKYLLKIFAVVLSMIIIAIAGQSIFIYQVFGWLTSHIRSSTGLDIVLVKGIAMIALAIILILPIGSLVLSLLPSQPLTKKGRTRKKVKRFLLLGSIAAIFFITYFASKNVYFDPATGKPIKYYTVSIDGKYMFSNSGGFDATTGDMLLPVTKDVIKKYYSSLDGNGGQSFGLEVIAKVYLVKFVNQTEKTLFICISKRLNSSDDLTVNEISAGDSLSAKLIEGNHVFACMDINGKDLVFDFTSAEKNVSNAYALKENGFPAYVLTPKIKGAKYELENTYYLKVLPSDNMSVVFDKNNDIKTSL